MKDQERFLKSGITALLLVVWVLTGCGKREDEDQQKDWENTMEDAESSTGSWRGDVYQFELEGKNADALNGKIASILLADDSWVYASTADGSLFMLCPSIYYSQEDSEIKSYEITDDCGINELLYADQHIAYGKNHFVYFDMMEGFDEEAMADLYMLESLSDMPDIAYTFENMQKEALSDDRNLIFLTEDAAFYVYEDTDHHIRAGYKDSYSEEYTTYADVIFEGDTERSGVVADKSIFRFLLTEDNELLYIKKASIASDLADNVEGVSVSYADLTNQIDVKVTDIYNLLNNTECCYAVDEEQNIYYVSTVDLDDISAEKITQFENGTIADIQGFAGMNDEMLIKTEEGAYYFCDSDSLYPVRKVDALDGNYKDAVLLMEGDILALGNDGYLYVIEDKN